MMEPFHPKRHGGLYYDEALKLGSIAQPLAHIWRSWNGIKHVWEPNGWPFMNAPAWNLELGLQPETKVINLFRRNLLKRLVSYHICRQANFWIGSKERFQQRIADTQLRALDVRWVIRQLREDQIAIDAQRRVVEGAAESILSIAYEDLFDCNQLSSDCLSKYRDILAFLGKDVDISHTSRAQVLALFDVSRHKWADADLYRKIPGIEEIEEQAGSNTTGWLFRGDSAWNSQLIG